MCGRYTIGDVKNLSERYDTSNELEDINPNYNVAPGQYNPVVDRESPNKLEKMKWGLIPFWAKDPRIGYKMINARAESVSSKPSFRKSFKEKRCLIPATGFYEWKREGKDKIPFFIHLKNQEIFSFAGLYDEWKDVEGKKTRSYTIITTNPNKIMGKIHNRMPVILYKKHEDEWLNNTTNQESLLNLLQPYTGKDMEAYIVSKEVNKPINNSPNLIKKA